MAEDGSDEKLQPIIIVKRGGGDHDDHHGGVWKIAFADFMTAMMAFFLVMWLINASNDETRSQVASYFNPVKLTDAVTAPKGVRHSDPVTNIPEKAEDAGQGGQPGQGGKTGDGEADDATEAAEAESADNPDSEVPEAALFKDPYAVLVEIAGEAQQINIDEGNGKPSDGNSGLAGGEAFRDPFDPAFWQEPDESEEQANKPETAMMSEAATGEMKTAEAAKPDQMSQAEAGKMDEALAPAKDMAQPMPDQPMTDQPMTGEPKKMTGADAKDLPTEQSQMKTTGGADMAKAAEMAEQAKTAAEEAARRERVVEDLRRQIAAVSDSLDPTAQPRVSVENTDEGFVVSLTDDMDFGMFSVASARPNADMVRFMDRIAAVLSRRPGRLIIRGHTDSRPFRSERYDNWRLSTARAHMAYHMLVRGGIREDRFARIEGRADRDPRNRLDSESAENRRIEILLVEEKS